MDSTIHKKQDEEKQKIKHKAICDGLHHTQETGRRDKNKTTRCANSALCCDENEISQSKQIVVAQCTVSVCLCIQNTKQISFVCLFVIFCLFVCFVLFLFCFVFFVSLLCRLLFYKQPSIIL